MVKKRHIGSVVAAAVLAVVFAASVSAVPTLPPAEPRADVPTEIILDGTGPGHGVSGFIGPAGSASSPGVPYPPPTAGFTPLNEGFAGIIFTSPPGAGGPQLQMYCIDILTPTGVGYGYTLGTWGEANVTNVGHVALAARPVLPEHRAAGDTAAGHRQQRRPSGRGASGDLVLLRQLRPGTG